MSYKLLDLLTNTKHDYVLMKNKMICRICGYWYHA